MIRTRPGRVRALLPRLERLDGVSVDRSDDATGHVIAVIESGTLAGQEECVARVQALPDVLAVALVAHHFGPADATDRKEHQP